MISQEGNLTSSGSRARGRTTAAILGVLTLLAAAIGARGVGSPAQAATVADLAQQRDQAVAVHLLGSMWAGEPITVPGAVDPCTNGFAITLRTGRQG